MKNKDILNNKGISVFVEDNDDIVILLSANGVEIYFVEIAGIAYKGLFYAILKPVELWME